MEATKEQERLRDGCMRACMYMRACVHACMRACVHACMRAHSICMHHVRAYMHTTCMYMCVLVHMQRALVEAAKEQERLREMLAKAEREAARREDQGKEKMAEALQRSAVSQSGSQAGSK